MNKDEAEAIEEIRKLGFVVASASYSDLTTAKEGNHLARFWNIPSENYKLENTPFFKNTENDYVHFTTIKNLLSILESRSIRMYNLESMKDKFEMDHIRKRLRYPDFIEFNKKELYCLSMCCTSVINSQMKEHLLWKLYGEDGKGVVIRFSFQNNLQLWYNFHLTKVFYHYKIAKPILRLNQLTKREYLDAKIGCFLKLPIYKFENETRLVFENREGFRVTERDKRGNLLYPIIHPDTRKGCKNVYYNELPLWNFYKNQTGKYTAPNVQDIAFEIPKIQVDEIIAGYNVSEKELNELKEKCRSADPSINVKSSKLKKYY